jgi:peroxiredoxin
MLSDSGFTLAAALDLPTLQVAGMRLYRRMTLVVRDQVIEHVFHPVTEPERHAEQVLAWLQSR